MKKKYISPITRRVDICSEKLFCESSTDLGVNGTGINDLTYEDYDIFN